MLPVARWPETISDHALSAVSPESTVTVTTLHRSQSPRQEYPFQFPDQWKSPYGQPPTTSAAPKQSRWRLDLPPLLGKTVKIPQKYRQPTPPMKLPKGWVYDEDAEEVKREEVGDPSLYTLSKTTGSRTRAQHRQWRNQEHDPYRRLRQGYQLNRGPAYIPFTITNHHGQQVPAQFIQVNMTDNPYALARLEARGATYRGEIHAAPVNDVETPPERLTVEAMRMFSRHFPIATLVDNALAREQDVGLTCEVRQVARVRRTLGAQHGRASASGAGAGAPGVGARYVPPPTVRGTRREHAYWRSWCVIDTYISRGEVTASSVGVDPEKGMMSRTLLRHLLIGYDYDSKQ